MEQLKSMKESLTSCVQGQLANLQAVDYQELGAAIDMIKDLSEAIYYCTITEAMEGKDDKNRETYYYTERIREPYWHEDPSIRDMDRERYNRMYYGSNSGRKSSGGNSRDNSSSSSNIGGEYYSEREYAMYPRHREDLHDPRDGRSYQSRRMYMESKEMHKDKNSQMEDLEKYMQELTGDLTEMIEDSTPEEKAMLSKKLTALASKVQNGN